MMNKMNSSNLVRPLAIVAVAITLLLEGLPPVSASAAVGDVTGQESSYSSQVNIPSGLTDISADAASVSQSLMLKHNTTYASLSENLSYQIDIADGRLRGGGKSRHGRKG